MENVLKSLDNGIKVNVNWNIATTKMFPFDSYSEHWDGENWGGDQHMKIKKYSSWPQDNNNVKQKKKNPKYLNTAEGRIRMNLILKRIFF